MEKLNLENVIFGEKEETPPKPLYLHWILLAAALVMTVLLSAWWVRNERAQVELHEVQTPNMIVYHASSVFDAVFSVGDVTFYPMLDSGQWGGEKMSFHMHADRGYFIIPMNFASPSNAHVENGAPATWKSGLLGDGYVEFVAWAGDHIVGYALAKIEPLGEDSLYSHSVEILGSVTFPMENGEFQNVTEEYVQEQIKELKKK